MWKQFRIFLVALLLWQPAVEACDTGTCTQSQEQSQSQTAGGGNANVKTYVPPDFVEPFPGVPIPQGFLGKKAKNDSVFNDMPTNENFKVFWINNGKSILMLPEANPYFYSQRRVSTSNYSWIRLKGQVAKPYRHVGDFTIFGADEGYFSEPNTFQEIQVKVAEVIGANATFSDEVVTTLSVDVQPQSVTSGIMPAGSAADSNAQVVGGVGMGRSSNHLTSRAVVTAHVFMPLLSEISVTTAPPAPPQVSVIWTVQFDFDKYDLDAKAISILTEAVEYLKSHSFKKLEVDGHTCSVGPDTYNSALSDRRAESVVRFLTVHGISAEKLTPKGLGEAKPLNENETYECRKDNRRAELRLLK
jgi:outer membrane protein OmpA-like peptidoglycan-associated protein